MRKVATTIFVLILSGVGAMAATEAPKPADKPRTMEEVIDRVITNENRANQQLKQFSPLVETYIQNLKPDKDLGYAPAGDKYFLGRADFSKGVSLVSLTDTNGKGKKIFGAIGNFFSFAMQFLPDGFLQMIFIDTNGFDKHRNGRIREPTGNAAGGLAVRSTTEWGCTVRPVGKANLLVWRVNYQKGK